MADPKESPEIPEAAVPEENPEVADAVQPASSRDPELEALLKSRSSDNDDATPERAKKTRSKRDRPAKTGTSLDKKSKRPKTPLIAALVAAVLIVGGGGTALWMTLSPGASQIDPDRNKDRTQKAGTKKADPATEATAPWNTEAGVFPIALDEWQKGPGTEGLSPEGEAALLDTFAGSYLSSDASLLPSEAAGFTSDDNLIFNEDESINPLYSFWTQESYTAAAGQIVEKFLNPRFGNWESYQGRGADPNGIDPATLFPNTFTNDALQSGGAVASWLPIYADWGNDSYGRGDLSATGARWYGQITSSTSEFIWHDEESQYSVNFVADVKFTAYRSNGEKVSEKGKLTLEFVANPGGERGSGGKVLVNKSNLTIGG